MCEKWVYNSRGVIRMGRRRCIIPRAYKERGHATPIDGEVKSVTKNSNTKTWTFSLLGVLGKYTENSKISLSLVLLKIVYFAVE